MHLTNSHREQVKSKKVLKYLKNCFLDNLSLKQSNVNSRSAISKIWVIQYALYTVLPVDYVFRWCFDQKISLLTRNQFHGFYPCKSGLPKMIDINDFKRCNSDGFIINTVPILHQHLFHTDSLIMSNYFFRTADFLVVWRWEAVWKDKKHGSVWL